MESSYDVFASYRRQDGQAVQTIATRLRDQGLKVWFDRWSLTPGLPWQPAIETAVAQCRTIAVFIGPPGIGGWQEREMRQALDRQVQDSDLRVIPVLLPGATPPEGFIAIRLLENLGKLEVSKDSINLLRRQRIRSDRKCRKAHTIRCGPFSMIVRRRPTLPQG
ncbi:toll/interleukin-1 receptor domain-containing protein, partial [Streptomyces neyagawaensis]